MNKDVLSAIKVSALACVLGAVLLAYAAFFLSTVVITVFPDPLAPFRNVL
ncbi:MAG: hypothetical protein NXI24_15810 [bacterium]|nr:hypothetical protein [bacterium]